MVKQLPRARDKETHRKDNRETSLSNNGSPRVSSSSDTNQESVVSRSSSRKHRSNVNANGSFSLTQGQSTPKRQGESTKNTNDILSTSIRLPPPTFPIQFEHPSPVQEDTEVESKDSLLSPGDSGIPKSDSNGFLSSLFNVAQNAATIIMSPTEEVEAFQVNGTSDSANKEQAETSVASENVPKPRKDTFSSRLESLLKSKSSANKQSPENEPEKKEKEDEQPQERSQIETNKSNSAIPNVHFESTRESPLNSLGEGDLTLESFDNKTKNMELKGDINPGSRKDSLDKPTNGTINPSNIHTLIGGAPSVRNKRSDSINRRIMITPNQSTDNLHDHKRSLSPGFVNRSLPSNSQLAVYGNGESKVVHRRSIGNQSNTDLVRLRSQTISRIKSNEPSDDDLSDSMSVTSPGKPQDLGEIVDYSDMKFAPKKKNREFHNAFKYVPHGDRLIEDCSCALSKDFLVQGRMYISESYICFNSNILGWVTNLTIPLQEVIQIEKKSTAVLFPNGMIIRTLHHKYVFATFLSRDTTFNLITNIWHRVLVKGTDAEPSKLAGKTPITSNSDKNTDESDDDRYSDQESDITDDEGSIEDGFSDGNSLIDDSSITKGLNGSGAAINDDDDDGYISEDISCESENEIRVAPSRREKEKDKDKDKEKDKEKEKDRKTGDETFFNGFPVVGPLSHAPTNHNYSKQANETFICEETLNGPLGVVYLLLFGSDASPFIKILKAQKNYDISESDITGLSTKNKERHYVYTKPLNGPIGPKSTKCNIEDKLIEYSLDKYILVEQITATPDVPSGNSFKVKTKLFLTWAPSNLTKLFVVTTIEWSAKSWIKGAIEKGSIEGQKDSMKVLIEKVNEMLKSGANRNESISKSKGKNKKKPRSRKNTDARKDRTSKKNESEIESEVKNDSISVQFTNLVTSIGKCVPIQIPFVSDFIAGIVVIVLGLFIFRLLSSFVSSWSNHSVSIEGFSTSQVSRISINDEKFLVIPSIDTKFKNKKSRMETEVELWNWIKDRSANNIDVKSSEYHHSDLDDGDIYHRYSNQEIREIIDITKLKLEKLNERLNL